MNRSIRRATRKARKQHHCSPCGTTIPVGQPYADEVVVGDGIWHWRTCQACQDDEVYYWVTEHSSSMYDTGLTADDCHEWAHDVVDSLEAGLAVWPPDEVEAARRFLARAGEEPCHD